jgi:tripartite-type tricarboxylate transporter receptor subunit TctC
MFIPSGASTLIAQKLFDTSKQILQKPEIQQQFATQTMSVVENYSLQFLRDYISEEIVQWKKIVNSIEPKKKS